MNFLREAIEMRGKIVISFFMQIIESMRKRRASNMVIIKIPFVMMSTQYCQPERPGLPSRYCICISCLKPLMTLVSRNLVLRSIIAY